MIQRSVRNGSALLAIAVAFSRQRFIEHSSSTKSVSRSKLIGSSAQQRVSGSWRWAADE
jgi:hypothetical protein